jgi:xanthosine phosphorylase
VTPEAATEAIKARAPGFTPRAGLVLGSGLGPLAEEISTDAVIGYDAIPGFVEPQVEGHVGRLVLGRFGGVPVACLQGRSHLYEGHDAATLALPVRTLQLLGCELLVLTNAAGSLNPDFSPGSLMLIADHINLLGRNPLIGANDDSIGPRFPDMTEAYDAELRVRIKAVAATLDMPLNEGVYLALLGPNFETPAEIRAFRTLGADAVGMSTVTECIAARHCGLRVAGLSILTNLAAGMTETMISHDETLAIGKRGVDQLARLLPAFFEGLSGT